LLGSIASADRQGRHNDIPLAERAINEYLEATPPAARRSGLRLLHVLTQRDAVLGGPRNVADTVNSYIERKLQDE